MATLCGQHSQGAFAIMEVISAQGVITMPTSSSRTRKSNGLQRATFHISIDDIPVALSYDDVLLVPRRTTVVSRRTVDVSTHLSRNIRLNMPIVSANMDTVTESAMAIEMARHGGIGIIHRLLWIDQQAAEELKGNCAANFIIQAPYSPQP